jgi:type IV pilus assembly protein PilA
MIARMHKSMEEKDKGFTLIELLVVIIIIGILSAIAIPVFLNQRKKAVDAGIKSDLRTVAQAIETYYTDNQAYPATLTSSSATATPNTFTVGTDVITLTKGDVISYTLTTGGESYTLKGINAKGTADSATNKYFKYDSANGGLNSAIQTT